MKTILILLLALNFCKSSSCQEAYRSPDNKFMIGLTYQPSIILNKKKKRIHTIECSYIDPVNTYDLGIDMSYSFSKHFGVGLLVSYRNSKFDYYGCNSHTIYEPPLVNPHTEGNNRYSGYLGGLRFFYQLDISKKLSFELGLGGRVTLPVKRTFSFESYDQYGEQTYSNSGSKKYSTLIPLIGGLISSRINYNINSWLMIGLGMELEHSPFEAKVTYIDRTYKSALIFPIIVGFTF